MADLELDEIHRLLSVPGDRSPGNVSRRRFLQGALAAGTLASSPIWFDQLAAAASPVGATEGILIVIHMGGGNDGLNTVVPVNSTPYRTLRGNLAIASPLPLTSAFGLHPALPKLKARYAAGKVAIVHGVGQSTLADLSHFSSTASWMAGTSGTSRTTGWLGRWLDGVSESTAGLRAVTVGSSVPLHLVGQQAQITALDVGGDLFGADRSEPWMTSVYDAISGYGGTTGKGAWADRLGAAGASVDPARRRPEPGLHPGAAELVGEVPAHPRGPAHQPEPRHPGVQRVAGQLRHPREPGVPPASSCSPTSMPASTRSTQR